MLKHNLRLFATVIRTGKDSVSIDALIRLLWSETWWRWNRPANEPLMFNDYACHYFNLGEAAIWFGFSFLVFRRWQANHRSALELWYAFAFAVFGASDLLEAWSLTSWLLWWKAANLLALLVIRRTVIKRHYPDSRLY